MTQPELDPTAAYGTTAFVPPPNRALAASAQIGDYQALYRRSLDDPDAFWREAAQAIMWHQPFAQVLGDRSPSRNRSPSCPSYPKRARARSCAGCLKRKPWVNRWVTPARSRRGTGNCWEGGALEALGGFERFCYACAGISNGNVGNDAR